MKREELIAKFEAETGDEVVFHDECLYPNTGEDFSNWLIAELTKKDAEIDGWIDTSSRAIVRADKAEAELQSLKGRIEDADKAYGRDLIYDKTNNVKYALVELMEVEVSDE